MHDAIEAEVEYLSPQTVKSSISVVFETPPSGMDRTSGEGRPVGRRLATPPPVPLRIFYFLFAYSIIMLGLFLLVFAVANAALLTLF